MTAQQQLVGVGVMGVAAEELVGILCLEVGQAWVEGKGSG